MALQGFVETYYLNAKLVSLQQTSPEEWGTSTTEDLKAFFETVGFTPESHYQTWGWTEGLAPNAYYNEAEYVAAKGAQLFDAGLVDSIEEGVASFNAAWSGNPYDHYLQWGAGEGINPSNAFDSSAYLAAKLLQLQEMDAELYGEWTVDDVAAAFADAGLTPLGHFIAWGVDEGLTAIPVPDETFTLTEALAAQEAGTLPEEYTIVDEVTADAVTSDIAGLEAALVDGEAAFEFTVEEQAIIDGAVSSDITINVPYVLADSLEALTAADAEVFAGAESYSITDEELVAAAVENVTVADLAEAQAAAIAAVLEDPIVAGASNVDELVIVDGAYTIADTLENIVIAELPEGVVYTLTDEEADLGELTPEAGSVAAGATNAADFTWTVLAQHTLIQGAETFVGTDANDTIEGVASSLAADRTLDAGDNIDGGEGADTLNIDMEGNFTGFTADVGGLKNVETVNLTNEGTIARSFAAVGVEGVETYNLTGAINLSGLAATDATINLAGRASGTTTIGYADKVTDGTADALALGLANIGTVEVKNAAGTVTTAQAAVTVTATGIEEVAITASGANVAALGADNAKALTVAGDGSLKLTEVGTGLKTIEASTMTGALDVDLADATGVTAVSGGAGDDVFRATVGDLAVNAEINGGEGADTLALHGNIGTVQYQMSGVETIEIDAVNVMTFSATNTSGVENLTVKGAGNAATFTSMGAGDLNVTLSKASSGTVSSDHSGSTTVTVTGGTKAAPTINDVDTTFTKSTSVNLTVDQYNTLTGNITANAAQTFVSNSAGTLTNALNLAAATSAVFNQTDKDAAATVTLNASKLAALEVTTAANFDLTGSTLTGLESLVVDTNKVFTIGDLAKVASVELSGSGTAAEVVTGALGTDAVDYNIAVSATGLAAGVDITGAITPGINTGIGQTVDVNVAGVVGAVTIGGITVKNDGTAKSGTISVDANGTGGAITLGTLNAKTVSVDATGALQTLGATVNAETATVLGAGLGVNTVSVTASKAGAVSGGIAADAITVVSSSAADATATFTLSGGLGADVFDVTKSATGKSVVTISDFSVAQGDVLDINAATTELSSKAEAATFFGTAFGTTFLDTDVEVKTVGTVTPDTYYVIKGSAYIAQDADTNGVFENKDLAIKLNGVTDLGTGEGTIVIA